MTQSLKSNIIAFHIFLSKCIAEQEYFTCVLKLLEICNGAVVRAPFSLKKSIYQIAKYIYSSFSYNILPMKYKCMSI